MTPWHLQFAATQIQFYADKFAYYTDIGDELSRRVKAAREYSYEDFLHVCDWKSSRPKRLYRQNTPEQVRQATSTALRTGSERERMACLLALHGVGYPVASVLLHFGHNDPYPILDRRALWSLGLQAPPAYSHVFWWKYVVVCRELAQVNGVSMRVLDRALWQFSKMHERPPARSSSRCS